MASHNIAHVLWDTAPYLAVNLVKHLQYPKDVVYAREMFEMSADTGRRSRNLDWTEKLTAGMYVGYLRRPWICRIRRLPIHLSLLCRLLFTDFSLRTWFMIMSGPRNWVFHGAACSFTTMLLLRCLGKRVVLLHWGGKPSIGKYKGLLDRWSYRLYNHLFVLITPEIKYFSGFVKASKLSVLPYPSAVLDRVAHRKWSPSNPQRWLLIGNNGLVMDAYNSILDKIVPGSWEKIICMLNYGEAEDSPRMRSFVEKYKDKFGTAFTPWIKIVPYDEYLKYMENCCAYICPWERQSGIGAAYTSAAQGKAVFLAGDNYEWMHENGIMISKVDALNEFSFEEISQYIPDDDAYEKILLAIHVQLAKYPRQYWHNTIDEVFA